MKITTAIIFISKFVTTITCMHAQGAKVEKRMNPEVPPYLFFLKKNDEDQLIVYEQLARKSPSERSILTVMRISGGKTDVVNFTAKVEALKVGSYSFRILGDRNDALTMTKAKELLGIKSNSFKILFRGVQGQMPKILLSIKDSSLNEKGGTEKPAQESKPEGNKKTKSESGMHLQ